MSYTWEVVSGRVYDSAGAHVGTGYSGGDCGKVPEAINDPDFEGVVNEGPLPTGIYTRGTLIWDHPRLGAKVVPLIPDAATRSKIIGYGRDPDSFFMHGDDIARAGQKAASDGCPVVSPDVRMAWYSGPDPELEVVAKLPTPVADIDGEVSGLGG